MAECFSGCFGFVMLGIVCLFLIFGRKKRRHWDD